MGIGLIDPFFSSSHHRCLLELPGNDYKQTFVLFQHINICRFHRAIDAQYVPISVLNIDAYGFILCVLVLHRCDATRILFYSISVMMHYECIIQTVVNSDTGHQYSVHTSFLLVKNERIEKKRK